MVPESLLVELPEPMVLVVLGTLVLGVGYPLVRLLQKLVRGDLQPARIGALFRRGYESSRESPVDEE